MQVRQDKPVLAELGSDCEFSKAEKVQVTKMNNDSMCYRPSSCFKEREPIQKDFPEYLQVIVGELKAEQYYNRVTREIDFLPLLKDKTIRDT